MDIAILFYVYIIITMTSVCIDKQMILKDSYNELHRIRKSSSSELVNYPYSFYI